MTRIPLKLLLRPLLLCVHNLMRVLMSLCPVSFIIVVGGTFFSSNHVIQVLLAICEDINSYFGPDLINSLLPEYRFKVTISFILASLANS